MQTVRSGDPECLSTQAVYHRAHEQTRLRVISVRGRRRIPPRHEWVIPMDGASCADFCEYIASSGSPTSAGQG